VALKALPRDISLKYQLRRVAKGRSQAWMLCVLRCRKSARSPATCWQASPRQNASQQQPCKASRWRHRRWLSQAEQHEKPEDGDAGIRRRLGAESGPNRAYHSHLVEFGTQSRSAGKKADERGESGSCSAAGFRTIISREKEKPRRLAQSRRRSQLAGHLPREQGGQYPKDFIATGTVRGAPAQHPLQSASNNSRQKMQSVPDTEMQKRP
jgi:hypothetical protein